MNLVFRKIRDNMIHATFVFFTIIVVIPLFVIMGFIIWNGLSSLNLDFFIEELGSPARAIQGLPTGLVAAIVGTIIIDFLGLLIALPFGLATGIMLSEYSDHPLCNPIRILVSTLNGMPAILMGLMAYAIIVKNTGGFSGFSGAIALGFLMIPIIARTTESVLRITPWNLREVALSLGLPRWRAIMNIVLPTARPAVITGILIAFARAAGEAAPMLLTAFGNNYLNLDLSQPMDTLPQRLYSLAISPYKQWHVLGWGGAIILLLFVVITFATARITAQRLEKRTAELTFEDEK